MNDIEKPKPDRLHESAPFREEGLTPPETLPCARVRWSNDGNSTDLEIDGTRGLIVLPVGALGREQASLLVESLDRAASGGRRKIQISRKNLLLELQVPDGWPRAAELPSIVLGAGSTAGLASEPLLPFEVSDPELARRAQQLDPESLAAVVGYPRRRRELAARRRRVESELIRQDDLLRSRTRGARVCLIVAVAALMLAVFGGLVGQPLAMLASAGTFFILSAVVAWERSTRAALRARRARIEEQLGQVADLECEVESQARQGATRLGYEDSWEAAARLKSLASAGASVHAEVEDPAVIEKAEALARALGLDASSLDLAVDGSRPALEGGRGWPPEVTATGIDLTESQSLMRIASLLSRVEGSLSPAWPLVLFDPWPDHETADRARVMLAISEVVRPRPVLALIPSVHS